MLPRHLIHIVLLAPLSLACNSAPPTQPPRPQTTQTPVAPNATRLDQLIRDSDARHPTARLTRARLDPNPQTRVSAYRAIGDIPDMLDQTEFLQGLRDPDENVRLTILRALSNLGTTANSPTIHGVATLYATELSPTIRSQALRTLARIHPETAIALAARALQDGNAELHPAACDTLALADHPSRENESVALALAHHIQPDAPEETRYACAHALARIPSLNPPLAAIRILRTVALNDPSHFVRVQVLRALTRQDAERTATLLQATQHSNWQVAATAYQGLAATTDYRASNRALQHALSETFTPLFRENTQTSPQMLHVYFAALRIAQAYIQNPDLYALIERLYDHLDALPQRSIDTQRLHCAVAYLLDFARAWPSRIRNCGDPDDDQDPSSLLEARLLGSISASVAPRRTRLARLLEHPNHRVRQRAIRSLAQLHDPNANLLILSQLRETQHGTLIVAIETLQSLLHAAPSTLPRPSIENGLRHALRTLEANDDLEGLATWLQTVQTLELETLASEAARFTHHHNITIRAKARSLLRQLGQTVPEGTHQRIPNPIDSASIPGADDSPRVRVDTSRGPMIITLRPDIAPTTVARFLSLVREDFYRNLYFHRVVPAFVAQGGDPQGDGYGGPGWSQRCEQNSLTYARGTVGMALAGRDTGGSQFFITHLPTPHLNGRYTAFGQITEGIDILDQIHEGDRIINITQILDDNQ